MSDQSSVRPIRTDEDHSAALAEIERLMDLEPAPGSAEADRLDLLATLVDAYEARHHAIDPPDPIEAIKHRLDALGLDQRDLERVLNASRSRVWEVMHRQRALSIPMMRRLHAALHISGDILLQPYELKPR